MKLVMAGVSYKDAPLQVREKFAVDQKNLPAGLDELAARPTVSESVILSTCNRVEVYVLLNSDSDEQDNVSEATLDEDDPAFDFLRKLAGAEPVRITRRANRDAVRHLLRVTSSLDSMVVGEPEILSQVARALETARDVGTAGSVLSQLFLGSVRAARKVRLSTGLGRGRISVASIALLRAEKVLGNLSKKKVLLVGAGEIAAATVKNLRDSGAELYGVTSRTGARAEELVRAAESNTRVIDWFNIRNHLVVCDVLIVATAAPHPIFRSDDFIEIQRSPANPLLVLDLAVPRNVEPAANEIPGVVLLNIDDLQAEAMAGALERRKAADAAEILIERETDALLARLKAPEIEPALKEFAQRLRAQADEQLDNVIKALKLSQNDEKFTDILRHAFRQLAARVTHPALSRLKKLARSGDVAESLRVLQEFFDIRPVSESGNGNEKRENEKPAPH